MRATGLYVQFCREAAMHITEAAKGTNARLVTIAKDRLGHEEYTRDYWPPPAELYFDTAEEGHEFFKATNGDRSGLFRGILNFVTGGNVSEKLKRANNIAGKGAGRVLRGGNQRESGQ